MAKINLRLLNLSDWKVIPAEEKPLYVFVKTSGETIGNTQDTRRTLLNHQNEGFANLIRKFTVNNDQVN